MRTFKLSPLYGNYVEVATGKPVRTAGMRVEALRELCASRKVALVEKVVEQPISRRPQSRRQLQTFPGARR